MTKTTRPPAVRNNRKQAYLPPPFRWFASPFCRRKSARPLFVHDEKGFLSR
ncbi:hypothetical protein GCWU000325_02244 [Alloprevotella tannerae ATCC 51259]|uniref:Uncharacterized protein n=1 Tax=Alloprevotella tannerae ATCC 51259 TaxID=626522 RepID=C9LJ31_9BACT|nr:hypothetical protein GCWU000325_02244 [Alloprevotella tannerae ATCC 51259]